MDHYRGLGAAHLHPNSLTKADRQFTVFTSVPSLTRLTLTANKLWGHTHQKTDKLSRTELPT